MSEKIFQQVLAPVLPRYTDEEMLIRSASFFKNISNQFSDKIVKCCMGAANAKSNNLQI